MPGALRPQARAPPTFLHAQPWVLAAQTSLEQIFNAFAAQQDEETGAVRDPPPSSLCAVVFCS